MTCRAMWLRFVPWVWERLELPFTHYWGSGGTWVRDFNPIANALHTEIFLATSVRYFYALLYPSVGADLRSVEVHEGASPGE